MRHPLEVLAELYTTLRDQCVELMEQHQKDGDPATLRKRMELEQIWDLATSTVPEHDLDAIATMLGVHDPRILTLPDGFKEPE